MALCWRNLGVVQQVPGTGGGLSNGSKSNGEQSMTEAHVILRKWTGLIKTSEQQEYVDYVLWRSVGSHLRVSRPSDHP